MARRKSHKLLITLFCLAFLAIGFSAGYYINKLSLKNFGQDHEITEAEDEPQLHANNERLDPEVKNLNREEEENPVEQTNNIAEATENTETAKITLNTQIISKERYLQCKHEITEVVPLSENLIGLTQKEFEERYPQWSIENFNEDEIISVQEIDDKCPSHYLVKQYDGKIGIFYIGSYNKNQLKQVLNINIDQLRYEDKENIINGIEINSDKELAQLIEDLTS